MDVSITTTKFSFPKYYGIFLLEMTFIHLLIQGLTKADVANRYCKEKKKDVGSLSYYVLSVVMMHLVVNKCCFSKVSNSMLTD